MTTFIFGNLPQVDQIAIRRGRCPWCLGTLIDGTLTNESKGDVCHECNDEFIDGSDVQNEKPQSVS